LRVPGLPSLELPAPRRDAVRRGGCRDRLLEPADFVAQARGVLELKIGGGLRMRSRGRAM